MLSFIIPAHNEELWIAKCLGSIRGTMELIAERYEMIVVDDASTDSTHRSAEQVEARTLQIALRKISAVRNAGARVAKGDVFFFVDADTEVNERAVSASLAALNGTSDSHASRIIAALTNDPPPAGWRSGQSDRQLLDDASLPTYPTILMHFARPQHDSIVLAGPHADTCNRGHHRDSALSTSNRRHAATAGEMF